MRRLRTLVASSIVVFAASLAHAFDFPPDAEFIVTDARGVIVAIGRTVEVGSASVEVLSGFAGPARLTLFRSDGTTHAIDVAIEDGVVTIEGVDLRVLLAEVFEHVSVAFVAEPGVGAEPSGDAQGGEAESGADREPPGQDRRPEEPPGHERRPDEPPGQDPGSDALPAEDRRPEEPPGQDRRPDEAPRSD